RRNPDAARAMLLEVIDIARETGSKAVGQSILEVSAGLAALRGEWRQMARFYGAAEAQKRRSGLNRDPADEAFLTPRLSQARASLGATEFSAAEVSGRSCSYEQALVDAGQWLIGCR